MRDLPVDVDHSSPRVSSPWAIGDVVKMVEAWEAEQVQQAA